MLTAGPDLFKTASAGVVAGPGLVDAGAAAVGRAGFAGGAGCVTAGVALMTAVSSFAGPGLLGTAVCVVRCWTGLARAVAGVLTGPPLLRTGAGLAVIGLGGAVAAALGSAADLAWLWSPGRATVGWAGLVGGPDLVVAGLGLLGAV